MPHLLAGEVVSSPLLLTASIPTVQQWILEALVSYSFFRRMSYIFPQNIKRKRKGMEDPAKLGGAPSCWGHSLSPRWCSSSPPQARSAEAGGGSGYRRTPSKRRKEVRTTEGGIWEGQGEGVGLPGGFLGVRRAP